MRPAIPPAGRADSDARRTLTLLVPGLIPGLTPELTGAGGPDRPAAWPEGADTGELRRLLTRADRCDAGLAGSTAALRRAFGCDDITSGDADADFPIAALTLLNDSGERPRGYWLRADPVHIQAGQDRLIMTGSAGLDLDQDEAQLLCAEINTHMKEEGLRLIAPTPARWYFQWPQAPEICFAPLSEVLGGDLYPHMPGGAAGRRWRRVLNEIQMLLHASTVNQRRRAQGRREISGVWIWGGGELPDMRAALPSGPYHWLWSDDPLARGLALNAGVAALDLPPDASAWLAQAGAGAHLLTIDNLPEPLRLGEVEDWCARLAALERQWLAPLAQALRKRQLDRLVIGPATGAEYHVTRSALRRWWRRSRPLTDFQ